MDNRLGIVVFVVILAAVVFWRLPHRSVHPVPAPAASAATPAGPPPVVTLADMRLAHPTHLIRQLHGKEPVEVPPANCGVTLVHYPAGPGPLAAYLSDDPHDGQRHPAIVWITGGDCNSIGDVWSEPDPANDQSATAYRRAGIVTMFVSLRGGNDNPGSEEKFLHETDDVAAAGRYLAAVPYVDAKRIYLGGHSTGGTMALLTAETTDQFRDVFCFGPVATVHNYGTSLGEWPFDFDDQWEIGIRSPGYWLPSDRSPTFVLEGADRGNVVPLQWMQKRARGQPNLHWAVVPGRTHFTILSPANEMLARKIVADTGPTTTINLTEADVTGIAGH